MDPEDALLGVLPGTTVQVDPSSAFPIAGDTGAAAGHGTGQYGITPLISGAGAGIGDAFKSLWAWLNAPFKTPMSPIDVSLLVGVVLIAIIAWNFILYHIRIAGEAI